MAKISNGVIEDGELVVHASYFFDHVTKLTLVNGKLTAYDTLGNPLFDCKNFESWDAHDIVKSIHLSKTSETYQEIVWEKQPIEGDDGTPPKTT